MTELYNLPNIRELLTNGFSDAELRALCFDLPGFRPVHDQLAQNTGTAEIAAKLLEYAEKTLQLDTLLALAKERNPARYEKHQPYYRDDPLPSLQKQVASLAQRLALLTSPVSLTREQQYQVALHWVELGRSDSLAHFDLNKRDLRVVDLSGADLRAANLSEADLSMANLSNADLRMANLVEANLTEINLHRAKLSQADLRGGNLFKGYVKYADLRKANLSNLNGRTNLMEANLEGANLSEANLQYANLSKSDLRMAFLPGANLCYADLREANLYKANLKQADLRGYKKREVTKEQAVSTVTIMARSAGWLKDYSEDENKYTDLRTANLEGIDLNGAKYNDGTIWPKGFDPSKAGAIYERPSLFW